MVGQEKVWRRIQGCVRPTGFLQGQMVGWVKSKGGYTETKEWVALTLGKTIPTPTPSEVTGGHSRLEENQVLRGGEGRAYQCMG